VPTNEESNPVVQQFKPHKLWLSGESNGSSTYSYDNTEQIQKEATAECPMHLWFIPMQPGVRRLQLEVLLGYS
jgi:hypothetical protein